MCLMSAVLMVFGLPLTLATYVFVVVTACTFRFVGPLYIYFFQNFPKFYFRGSVQGFVLD